MTAFIQSAASQHSMNQRKQVFGVGTNDAWYRVNTTLNGKTSQCPVYTKWHDMLKRCYSTKFQAQCPSYIGCTVVHEWLTFSNFAKWYNEHNTADYHLDKDLKVKGNREYSPDTCLFIPQSLNNLLLVRKSDIGIYPIGVSLHSSGKKYQASIKLSNKSKYLGLFNTIDQAQQAYITAKNEQLDIHIAYNPHLAEYLVNHKV